MNRQIERITVDIINFFSKMKIEHYMIYLYLTFHYTEYFYIILQYISLTHTHTYGNPPQIMETYLFGNVANENILKHVGINHQKHI